MSSEPDVTTLQQQLRDKTLALLARDRDFHALRDRHERAMGWLDAVDGLSRMGSVGETKAILEAWPAIAVCSTNIQYAAICEVSGTEMKCVKWFGARPLELSGELLLRPLSAGRFGAASTTTDMDPFVETIPLARFLWGTIRNGEDGLFLLLVGFDATAARFYPAFDPDDIRYMRMMCQHVETMLSLANSLGALRAEHQQLREANQALRHHDAELSSANQQLEQQSRELQSAITKLEDTQGQLLHSERLAAIGSLAAAVAHEINNPATYVLANLEELQSGTHTQTDQPRLLKETTDGVHHIVRIVRELRLFSRGDREPFTDLGAEDLVESVLRIAAGRVRHIAEVVTDIRTKQRLWGDPGQLAQVLLNLIINAAQAMEPGGAQDNTIRIELTDEEGMVACRVKDNGSGMAQEVIDKIFDPFFTTKSKDSGTGLGLSIVRQIIADHNGTITVSSTLGEGTEFVMMLPPAKLEPSQRPITSVPPPPSQTKNARVLLVDDDPRVLRVHERMLKGAFSVQTAASAQEALALIEQEQSWDAVVCDLMMPGLDGMQLRDKAAESHPALADRFLFVSGGVADERLRARLQSSSVRYLYKPFGRKQLVAAVWDILQ